MAKIIRREIRKRGFFGQLFKWAFILFNLAMGWWLFSYWATLGGHLNKAADEYSRAGAFIGGTIGTGLILFFWLAGTVIIGLFALLTRGKVTIVEETRTDTQGPIERREPRF
jgi:hypothetical protein